MTNENLTKFVVFKIGKETYALNVAKVLRIETNKVIRPIPNTIREVKGIINIQDDIVPVIDLRIKFNIESEKSHTEPYIIIIKFEEEDSKVGGYSVGFVVDEVDEVIDIVGEDEKNVTDVSVSGIGDTIGSASEYIQAIYKRKKSIEKQDENGNKKIDDSIDLLIILDLDKLLGLQFEEIFKRVE